MLSNLVHYSFVCILLNESVLVFFFKQNIIENPLHYFKSHKVDNDLLCLT